MSHAITPATGTPWWRRVLALEPVVVLTVIRAVLVLVGAVLAGFGLAVPESFEPWLVGVVVAFYALVEAVTAAVTRARATPTVKVVQSVEPDGTVLAGPASPLPTGTIVTTRAEGPDEHGRVLVYQGDELIGVHQKPTNGA